MTPASESPRFSPRAHFYRRLLPAYWIFLFCVTHFPRLEIPGRVPGIDKLLHAACFGLLAFLLWQFVETFRPATSARRFWTILMILAAYAILDEWLQSFVGRQTDLSDWLADVAGVLAVLVLLERRRRRAVTRPTPSGLSQ